LQESKGVVFLLESEGEMCMSKRRVASLCNSFRLSQIAHYLNKKLYKDGYIRAVNYHGTPPIHAKGLERQLEYYRNMYSPVSEGDLGRFLGTGKWHKSKPGLIISFDDGLKNNYDVALPLLEQYGFTGWFFIPLRFCQVPPDRQVEYADTHRIRISSKCRTDRVAMSAEEIELAAGSHVIGSHTMTHCRFLPDISSSQMQSEIKDSKLELEAIVGKRITSFAWVGGETDTYQEHAMKLIAETGYQFCFNTISCAITSRSSPLMLGRTNVEMPWPTDLVRFQLSGLIDVYYLRKKKKVHGILRQGIAATSA